MGATLCSQTQRTRFIEAFAAGEVHKIEGTKELLPRRAATQLTRGLDAKLRTGIHLRQVRRGEQRMGVGSDVALEVDITYSNASLFRTKRGVSA